MHRIIFFQPIFSRLLSKNSNRKLSKQASKFKGNDHARTMRGKAKMDTAERAKRARTTNSRVQPRCVNDVSMR